MPGNPLNNSALVTARGLRATFRDTYTGWQQKLDPRVGLIMDLGLPSDKLTEIYGYPESPPYLSRQPKGQGVAHKTFGSKTYEVTNHPFSLAIDWYREAELTDQLGGLFDRVKGAARNAAYLPEQIFWQMLLGATNTDLLPSVPTAPDGAAIFATTAGGAARFGATDGNLLSGSGVSTSAAVRSDFWRAISQFELFQDTAGEPLLRDDVYAQPIIVIHGSAKKEVMAEAFRQEITLKVGGTDAGAGVSNTVVAAFQSVQLWSTQKITDDDWFVYLQGAPVKPFMEQVLAPYVDNTADFENSDVSREYAKRAWYLWGMSGYGANLPYSLIKINN